MANTTESGVASVGDDGSGGDATAAGGAFHHRGTPPFGDPDQDLYGGGWHGSPAPRAAATPSAAPYEGRHRAAD